VREMARNGGRCWSEWERASERWQFQFQSSAGGDLGSGGYGGTRVDAVSGSLAWAEVAVVGIDEKKHEMNRSSRKKRKNGNWLTRHAEMEQ